MAATTSLLVTRAEKQLIEMVRALEYGELRILVKDKKPIRVEEIRKSIQLEAEK